MPSSCTSPLEVAEVFAHFGEQYRKRHKLPLQHRNAMFAIEHCRTSVMGGHVNACDRCGHKVISYNSCRNRHCPKCQGLNRLKWIDKLSGSLLPVRYFHIVFTLPSELNRLALVNQQCIYDMLFRAASETLLMLARDEKYLDAETGMVAVLHTWGQNMMDHPHLHVLVPAGGWSQTAQCWKPSRTKFFIPVKVISAVFRGKFLAMLRQAYEEERLLFEGEIKLLKLKGNFKRLLNDLYAKDWVVYAKKPFRSAKHIINYLGRYTHRVAISNQRLLNITNNDVSFTWKDYRDRSRQKVMTLSGEEFIRRFLLHILPKRFFKIRYYGIFASRKRKTALTQCKRAIGRACAKVKLKGLSWQQALKAATGFDVTVCPACKKGKMVTVAEFKGSRAPPDDILSSVL
jgi:hypothetical protein